MSDHRFEKQVGQKLDDLKLTPSAKSWENIEKEIHKDKRRPAPIFWLPLLLLGLGAIGYFVFNKSINKGGEHIIAAVDTKTSVNNTDKNPEKDNLQAGEISDNTPDETETADKLGKELISIAKRKQLSEKPTVHDGSTFLQHHQHKITRPVEGIERNREDSENTETIRENEPQQSSADASKGIEQQSRSTSELTPQQTLQQTPDSSTALKQHKQKTKKWSFGVNASGGLSSLTEGKLSFSNSQIALVPQNRTPLLSFASPAVVPPPASEPSKIYPGLSFSIGLTTKYNLSKRFSVSASVNYLQINTISKVGYKFEPTNYNFTMADRAETMYLPPANDQTRDYDNKYHYIELPITLHTRINNSVRLPLYWNAGFSVSKLIKSNSLYYDAVQRLYYSDDNLLKKTQTAVSTGLSFAVFNKTTKPLWIGPTVRYNLSQALKKEISQGNKHFMGVGVDVKWFIK